MAGNGRGREAKRDRTANQNGSSKRRWIPMTIAGLAMVGFAGGVWYAYNQGVREGVRLKPPLIRAEPGPTKVVPEQPGGLEIPNQDKMIYDRVTGETEAPQMEQLLPPSEKPSADAMARMPAATESAPAGDRQVATTEAAESGKTDPVPPMAAATAGASTPEKGNDSAVSEAAPAAGLAAVLATGWRIQLAAFRDETSAEVAWKRLAAKHADVLAALSHWTERVDLGPGKGVYYRLQAGTFADKDAAVAACEALKRNQQGCLPVAP